MSLSPEELRSAIESILLVAGEPVRLEDLLQAFSDATSEAVESELDSIKRRLEDNSGGFVLEQTAGGYRFATRPANEAYLRKFFSRPREGRLSLAALETLAIIAYRQPMTAPEIADIRGVNSTGVLRTLLDKRMIRIAGRKPVVGSPFLYRTSREFLVHFGLNGIQDLPRLEEFADILGENVSDELLGPAPADTDIPTDNPAEPAGDQSDETAGDVVGEMDDDEWPIGSERRSDEGFEELEKAGPSSDPNSIDGTEQVEKESLLTDGENHAFVSPDSQADSPREELAVASAKESAATENEVESRQDVAATTSVDDTTEYE